MDSETAITPNALRRMVVTNQVPCVKIGKKYLIDLDTLESFLKGTRPEDVLLENKPPIRIVQSEYRMRRAR
jgi:hypothetical protein